MNKIESEVQDLEFKEIGYKETKLEGVIPDNWISLSPTIEHLNWMATISKIKDNLYSVYTVLSKDQSLYRAVAARILEIKDLRENVICEFSLKGYSRQSLIYINSSLYELEDFYGTVSSKNKERERLVDTIITFNS